MPILNGKFLKVAEAADLIGVTAGRVRQLLRDGLLDGFKANERSWLVSTKSAKKMAKNPHAIGRPRNSKNIA